MPKDTKPFYFLTIFKIKDHKTWRLGGCHPENDGFDKYLSTQPKHPVVTERKVFKIDRVTGEII